MDDDLIASQARLGGSESRYTLERSLGRGGMGHVYLAWDKELGEYVALKMLMRVDAEGIARLKQEFRALAHLSHPNLVKLYELASAEGSWYFTMEYVDGVDLLSYVRRGERPPVSGLERERRAASLAHARLIRAFHQLAKGVRAIHRAGKLHRDLKPANVLVSAHRVVVLDFGLVEELLPGARREPSHRLWGTPEYMAPEALEQASEASDWYAFGTMLYEALTHELPFQGEGVRVLLDKQRMSVRPPLTVQPDVPEPLDALCTALLDRDPVLRPSGATVLATLDALEPRPAGEKGGEAALVDRASEPVRFVGREPELTFLEQAFTRALGGGPEIVHVRGPSGAGKSALVERFVGELGSPGADAHRPLPLVLRGRCYEREALPFKALDGVIDSLVAHLAGFDEASLDELLPPHVELLAQLFPALLRINRVQALLLSRPPRADPHSLKLAAQAAADLLVRIARQQPVVIWIDDLQWGDVDSVALLRGLLRIRGAPLLFLLGYRSDEEGTSACLSLLLEPLVDDEGTPVVRHPLSLRPLDDGDIAALIRSRLGSALSLSPVELEALAREASGSPFIALQLSALFHGRLSQGEAPVQPVSVDNLVAELNALLPSAAQKLLAALAVAGRPLAPALALRAAGVRDQGRAHLHTLSALSLVRMRVVGGERLLEVYHDRVREGVLSLLTPARMRRIHKELLQVLEETRSAEPDFLHIHARGASNGPKAYRYAREAAERAMEALAFDRAVSLYRECLTLVSESSHQEGQLWRRLGDALTRRGRGVEAAKAYLEAVRFAEPADALLLKRLAASHLVRSGHFAEGEALVREVLVAMGASVPESDAGLVSAILFERLRLGFRGMGMRPRAEHEISPAQLTRIDTFHALREETTHLYPLRSALFQARELRWALDTGEPKRAVAALCGAALGHAVLGTASSARTADALIARAAREAEQVNQPVTDAIVLGNRAAVHFMVGRFTEVLAPAMEAGRMFRSLPGMSAEGWYFQILSLQAVRFGALAVLGEYAQLRAEVAEALSEIRDTDNRGAILQLASIETIVDDVAGYPERSLPRLLEQRAMLPEGRLGMMHVVHLIAVLVAACATEQFELGLTCLRTHWQPYVRSPAYRVASFRSVAHIARAQLLLNHHVHEQRGPARGLIDADLRVLAKNAVAGNRAHRLRYQARLACLEGRVDVALSLFRASSEAYQQSFMLADHARNRYAEGRLIGGSEGQAMQQQAEQFLEKRGLAHARAQLLRYFPELHERPKG